MVYFEGGPHGPPFLLQAMAQMTVDKSKGMDNAFTAESLHQQASDPTYAGALSFMRRKYTKDLTGVNAVVWGIPLDTAVSNRPGTRFGPRGIREASCGMDNDPQYPFGSRLFRQMAVIDYGDCYFYFGEQAKVPGIIEENAAAIINAESEPYLLSLGGDHFVTYPLLKAHAEKHGPLALVQFDAHQDTWDDENGVVDHGTMITRAVKEGIIDVDHSIQIGIRTIAPEDYGIEIIDALTCHEIGPAGIAERVLDRVAGISLAQWRVLVMVGAGTATTARDISRKSIIDPAMISRTTHALEQAGMLQTHRPESDRRVVELSLTSRGREIYDRTLPYMQARHRELLAHLDPDERDAIYRILEKLESAAGERGFLDG